MSECSLIDVANHLEQFHAEVASADGSIQERPEVLQTVGVGVPAYLFLRVIDDLVCVFDVHAPVASGFIGVNL